MKRKVIVQLALLVVAAATLAWTIYRALEATESVSDQDQDRFEVELRVTSDDGTSVPGATLLSGEQKLGTTDAKGLIVLNLLSSDEPVVDLRLICPLDYVEMPVPIRIVLQPLTTLGEITTRRHSERHAICTPKEHTAVLVVRAPGASLSPIIVSGEVAGVTDLGGAARLAYRLRPRATLEVKIDTSARPEVIPQNPTRTFTMTEKDTLFVFEQSFEIDERRQPLRAIRHSPAQHAPYRLN